MGFEVTNQSRQQDLNTPPAPDADIATFLLSDGRLAKKPTAAENRDVIQDLQITLRELFESFFEQLMEGSLEDSTISQMQTHRNHLLRVLGDEILADEIELNVLDAYTRKRSREKGLRGRKLSSSTIRKELVTLRRVWQWGKKRGMLTHELPPIRDVQLPKSAERPPFQTYDEITQQIESGGLNSGEQDELWESLYLRAAEIDDLLIYVREKARHAFLYPMFVTAAHTGARRSELMRSRPSDIRGDVIIIREKKRRRTQESTRRVPMSSLLKETLDEWLENHPGGPQTFGVGSSNSGKANLPLRPLSRDQANNYFHQVL